MKLIERKGYLFMAIMIKEIPFAPDYFHSFQLKYMDLDLVIEILISIVKLKNTNKAEKISSKIQNI